MSAKKNVIISDELDARVDRWLGSFEGSFSEQVRRCLVEKCIAYGNAMGLPHYVEEISAA